MAINKGIALIVLLVVVVGAAALAVGRQSGRGSGIESPRFRLADGWNELSTGVVPMDKGPTAIAANVPIAPEGGYLGTFPTHTLAKLRTSDRRGS
jgi:hypothetical protein